jgi:DNA-binding CsgD family transcriptional regulator
MVGLAMGLPQLDAAGWGQLHGQVLDVLRIGVVALTSAVDIVGLTDTAVRLLEPFGQRQRPGERLRAPIAAAARVSLAETFPGRRPHPVRVAAPDGAVAVYVTAKAVAGPTPVTVLVWLHQEVLRDTALLEALRRRFAVSARDFQLVQQVRLGYTNKQIARNLGLTAGTVGTYLHNLFEELGVHSRAELVALVERLRKDTGAES